MPLEIDTIIIPLERYEQLVRDSKWLACLEGAGVDNWDGIDYAQDAFEENEI